MSDSQLDKKKEVEIAVPKPIKPMPTVIKPLNDKKTTTNEPKVSSPVDNDADLKSKFKAENIGRWAAKQENPFAEQNRKAQAKKQAIDKKRLKAGPIIGIVLGVICAIAAVVGLVVLVINLVTRQPEQKITYAPTIDGSSEEDVTKYQDLLQQFFNEQQNSVPSNQDDYLSSNQLSANINQVVQNTLNTSSGKANENAVLFAQLSFYSLNGFYNGVIEVAPKINVDQLSDYQKVGYYNCLADAYNGLGNSDEAQVNYDKMLEITLPVTVEE